MSFGSFTYPFLRLKSAMSHAHPSRGVPAASAPAVAGIHRLKFPVADLDASLAWYTSVMSAEHILALDRYRPNGQRFAAELKMPALGSVLLELRLDPQNARAARRADPITWGVARRADLEEWARWLDSKGVKRSGVLNGVVGWVMVFEDPDGRFLRLYTNEVHEKTTAVDKDDYWLGEA